ncbi:MAG: hypothetical protein Q8M20_03600 [Rhodocyclaceae bacterium]|nr:hypothetical protein [Rhodocyclaceae bacterium]MDZ4213464.1 hypothetical protein [Rhodocyclaceae bacterium]
MKELNENGGNETNGAAPPSRKSLSGLGDLFKQFSPSFMATGRLDEPELARREVVCAVSPAPTFEKS